MRSRTIQRSVLLWLGLIGLSRGAELGTAFTYQGNLAKNGSPVTDICDFRFGLWRDASSTDPTDQVGTTQSVTGVDVSNGVFATPIDFGPNSYDGTARWLEIEVQCSEDQEFSTLAPRVELTPVPHALALPGLWSEASPTRLHGDSALEIHTPQGRAWRVEPSGPDLFFNGIGFNMIGGSSINSVAPDVVGATIAGGGVDDLDVSDPDHANVVTGDFGAIGGGIANLAGSYAAVSGGSDNIATGQYSTVGGGFGNSTSGFVSTVCGGVANDASGNFSTVGGGAANDPSGDFSTIGGGAANSASGTYSTVGGGHFNNPIGDHSTVGGGENNAAGGSHSTVPGGASNQAGGDYSFAGGRKAKIRDSAQSTDADGDEGTFVWADSTDVDFTSNGPNQFLVRASGGSTIYSNSSLTAGVTLPAGGGAWGTVSDKNRKENFAEVDTVALLERLTAIPITTWNYISQADSIRHIGPMGQDFAAAFGVGEQETRITTIDADGVALAAIQGLYEVVKERDCEIEELRNRNDFEIDRLETEKSELRQITADLAARNNQLEARLARVEALLESSHSTKGIKP